MILHLAIEFPQADFGTQGSCYHALRHQLIFGVAYMCWSLKLWPKTVTRQGGSGFAGVHANVCIKSCWIGDAGVVNDIDRDLAVYVAQCLFVEWFWHLQA